MPVLGIAEQCTRCHEESQRFSSFHDPQRVSCEQCHGGDPESLIEEQAHIGMESFPGRMATAEKSCGQAECHQELIPLVKNSIMHTVDGMLSVTRRIYNDPQHPPSDQPLNQRLSERGADSYLRKLCVSCHLGTNRKSHLQTLNDRGGGCSACHLQSYRKIKKGRLTMEDGRTKVFGPTHPTLSISIVNDRCFGCHSRSGRISLNYVGLAETDTLDRSRIKDFGYLPDKRLVEKKIADIHSDAGMACIDCHTSTGLMGDGTRHAHQQKQLDIQCIDCHIETTTELCQSNCGSERSLTTFNRREAIYLSLYDGKVPPPKSSKIAATLKHKTPLLHLRKEDNRLLMHTKLTGKTLEVPRIKQEYYHTMKGHERLTCDSCHTGWAPQCYGCHVSYDPGQKQYDHLKTKKTAGRWIEKRWEVKAGLPTLGLRGDNKITPFIPGMNLTVDKGDGSKPFTKQYFSSTSPHTTQKTARSCESCHQSNLAMGIIDRRVQAPQNHNWITPIGWIKLENFKIGKATQPGARSFNLKEIKKIKDVGICLECHKKEDRIYDNFEHSMLNLTASCREK